MVKDIYEASTAIEEPNKLATSTEKTPMDEQAFDFWKNNVGTSLNNSIRVNNF